MRFALAATAAAASAALTACAAKPSSDDPVAATPAAPDRDDRRRLGGLLPSCEVADPERWIGRIADATTLEALRAASGATIIRIAPPPGTPMSMEGRPGRLTVTLDSEGRIASFSCE